MAQQLIGQTPRRTPGAKFANPQMQFGPGAGCEVLDQQVVRELFPMCPSRQEKTLGELVEIGWLKESMRAAVMSNLGQHAVYMVQRGEKLIA